MQKAGSIHQYAASYFAGASLVALLNGCGIDTLPGQGKSDVPRPQPETTRDVSTLTAREEIVGEPGGEAARAPAVERQPEGTGEIQKTVERLAAHKRIVNPAPEKTTEPKGITEEDLERKFKEQLEKIKEKLDELKIEDRKILKGTPFEYELPEKITRDDFSDFINLLNIVAFAFAGYQIWQARKHNTEQKKVVGELKDGLGSLDASTKKIESATRQSQIASYLAKQSLEEQKAIIRANRTERALERAIKTDQAERIGAFPEMYYYISERIQSAQNIVIITMPFYQFGILGSPHGLHDFHQTMHERFGNAAGSRKPHLVFITYDDVSRCVMARKRYSRAIYALDTLDDTPQSKKLESIFSKGVWKKLRDKLEDFQERLNEHEGSREILLRLAEEQTEWLRMKLANGQSAWEVEIDARIKRYQEEHQRAITYKEAMDMMFIKEYLTQKGSERHKKPFSALDEELFKELDKTRDAFSEAVEEQEGIYFHQTKKWNGTGTPWPEDMQIIKLTRDMLRPDQTFDNEITICIDGIEVIRAYSSLIPTGNLRKNNLMSQSGDKSIKYYTKQLSAFFEIAGLEQVKRIPEDVMIEIANRIPNIEAIEQFLTNPGPKV